MRYRYLDQVAIADVAFEAEGKTLEELFTNSALALTNTMVKDVKTIEKRVAKTLELEADNPEMLLHRFLQDLIFYKDARLLLFSGYDLHISAHGKKWRLRAQVRGEEINQQKHELVADVKAVSLHNFKVEKTAKGWRAEVILDV